MSKSHFVKTYATQKGILNLFAMNSEQVDVDFSDLDLIVSEELELLSNFITGQEQFLYVRNNKMLCIDGQYPAGHTYFPYESMVAVPSWQKLSSVELRAVIAHELHHMARWQNAGYGETLGGALTSEGIATYYEEIRTGRKPIWAKTKLPNDIIEEAIKDWDNVNYDHQKWFFYGPYGRWAGYSLGYNLAKEMFSTFDIHKSINISSAEFKPEL